MENKLILKASTIGVKSAQGAVRGLTGSVRALMASIAPLVGAYAVFEGLRQSIKMSGEVEGVAQSFKNLGKEFGNTDQFLSKLKDSTDGTVSSLELMKQANNAMLLGIVESQDEFAEVTDVAQRLARAVGEDAVYGIESLVTGMGRQSKLMLDNLGIIIDTNKAYETHAKKLGKSTSQLTDAEKKTAFLNATMESARAKVASLGEEQLTTADKTARATASLQDFGVKLGQALTPAYEMALDMVGTGLEKAGKIIDTISKTNIDTDKLISLDSIKVVADAIGQTLGVLIKGFSDNFSNISTLLGNAFSGGIRVFVDFMKGMKAFFENWVTDPIVILFKMAWTKVKEAFVGIANFVNEKLQDVIEGVVDGLNALGAKLPLFSFEIEWERTSFDSTLASIKEDMDGLTEEMKATRLAKMLFPDKDLQETKNIANEITQIWKDAGEQIGITIQDINANVIGSGEGGEGEGGGDGTVLSWGQKVKKSMENISAGIDKFMKGTGKQIQAVMGMANTTLNAYKQNVMSRKNAELQTLRESAQYQNADAERQKQLEKQVNSRYAKEQTKIWYGEQALNLSRVVMNTAQAITKVAPNPWLMGAMGAMGAIQTGLILTQKPPKYAQHGMDEIVSSPTQIIAGEAGRERVTITPLDIDEQTSANASISVSFAGNVLSDDFIVDEAIPKIRDAIRRGVKIA